MAIGGRKMFKNFNTENWLSFWSIGVPVILSAFGFIVSLILSFFSDRNKSRPIILISIEKHHKNGIYSTYLKIKNYGQTIGTIKSVKIDPLYTHMPNNTELEPNGFTKFKNFPIAPGQSITTMIATGQNANVVSSKERTFIIKYKPDFLKLFSYKEKYSIDEEHYPTIFSDGNFTSENRLKKLNEDLNIQLSQVSNSITLVGRKIDNIRKDNEEVTK